MKISVPKVKPASAAPLAGNLMQIEPMKHLKLAILVALLSTTAAYAQLSVTVSSPRVTGSKAVVRLKMKNNFFEKVESAHAVVFLIDSEGKMQGQSTRWVIGGTKDRPALEPKDETQFNFVIPTTRPVTTTNLTAKVNFTRLVLKGGKLADVRNDVKFQNETK